MRGIGIKPGNLLKPYQAGSYTLKSSGNSLSAMTLILIFDLFDHIDISLCPFLFGQKRTKKSHPTSEIGYTAISELFFDVAFLFL